MVSVDMHCKFIVFLFAWEGIKRMSLDCCCCCAHKHVTSTCILLKNRSFISALQKWKMINFLDIPQEKKPNKCRDSVLKFGMHCDVWNACIQLTDSLEIIYKQFEFACWIMAKIAHFFLSIRPLWLNSSEDTVLGEFWISLL